MSYVQVDADFLEADEVSIAPSKAMVSAGCPACTEQSSWLTHWHYHTADCNVLDSL